MAKLDYFMWNGGEIPRTEKAVNYVRPRWNSCSDASFLAWRIVAWLISTYHFLQDNYFTFYNGRHFFMWQYLTIIGMWLYWLNFTFLLFEHMRVKYK